MTANEFCNRVEEIVDLNYSVDGGWISRGHAHVLLCKLFSEVRIDAKNDIQPLIDSSGHYCDGMSHAWTDAQIAIDMKVQAETKLDAIRKILVETDD